MEDVLKEVIRRTHLPSSGVTILDISEESFFFSSTRFSISFMRFPISSVILAAVSLSALRTRGGGVTPDSPSLSPLPLVRSYFCFSLSFLGMTSSGVHESFKKQRQRCSLDIIMADSVLVMTTTEWFPHWIHKGDSKGLISKVEELLFQNGLRDVLFHLLKKENQSSFSLHV